ncbi:MAG: FAD-dependent oxidoreductase [Phycisphaerae bacterium]|nr:FAD-dependent oxidoreductase [Phycisphaerae bacterium]
MSQPHRNGEPEKQEAQWDQLADIVVVGGGGTGLAAALSAAENGADVVLLEKMDQLGGTTSIAVGSFTAACTPHQRDAEVDDQPEWHNEDIGKFAPHLEPKNNRELRGYFTRHAHQTLEWLMQLGLEFHGPSPEPPNRVPRMHNVVPNAKAYIAVMHRRLLAKGAKILLSHRVERLIRQGTGPVVGLEAKTGERVVRIRARRGVILAAGDYANGLDVKSKYMPEEVATIEGINPNATGDGHTIAEAVGADLVNMDVVYGPEIRFIAPPRAPFAQLLPANPLMAKLLGKGMDLLPKAILQRMIKRLLVTWQHPENKLFDEGAILVNQDGQRFTDETDKPELAIPRQPNRVAYILLDRQLAEVFSAWPNFISTAPDIAYAYIKDYKRLRPDVYHEADTIQDLARKIRVDPPTLAKTLLDYKVAISGLTRDPFGRTMLGEPLERPPFIALGPVKSWIVTTEGGLRINTKMQVLDKEGIPIPGLYAGGSNGMGGIVMWSHGCHIAWAITSGRLAGRNAAKRATD